MNRKFGKQFISLHHIQEYVHSDEEINTFCAFVWDKPTAASAVWMMSHIFFLNAACCNRANGSVCWDFIGILCWQPRLPYLLRCSMYSSYRGRFHTKSNMRRESPTPGRGAASGFCCAYQSRGKWGTDSTEEGERKLSLSAVFAAGVCPTSTPLNPVWQVLCSASLFSVSAAVRVLFTRTVKPLKQTSFIIF